MREGNTAIKTALYIFGLVGLALVTYLVAISGAASIAEAMLAIGWGLALVPLFHLVPMFLSNLSWRAMLPARTRPGLGILTWIRWIRESINSLLPVGQVGGDLVCLRLVYLSGVPGPQAAASMIVDLTVGIVTQMLFVALGLALLVSRSTEPAVLSIVWTVLASMGLFAVAGAGFLIVQRVGLFALAARIAGSVTKSQFVARIAGPAAAIDEATRGIYRNRQILWPALIWRLFGWIAGAGEIWLLMYFLGNPVSLAEALILESLGAGVRAVAFLVPGALGVLEGSFMVFGGLLGIAPVDSLVVALGKRVRELALGVPGLVSWQIVEGRRLLRRDR